MGIYRGIEASALWGYHTIQVVFPLNPQFKRTVRARAVVPALASQSPPTTPKTTRRTTTVRSTSYQCEHPGCGVVPRPLITFVPLRN